MALCPRQYHDDKVSNLPFLLILSERGLEPPFNVLGGAMLPGPYLLEENRRSPLLLMPFLMLL